MSDELLIEGVKIDSFEEFEEEIKKITSSNEMKENKDKTDYIEWVKSGNNTYFPSGKVVIVDNIPPGIYEIGLDQNKGYFLQNKEVNLDELFVLPSKEQDAIIADIRKFWIRKQNFDDYGFNYKRGILLYGAPGNGKTSIFNLLSKEIVEKYNGIIFHLKNSDELKSFSRFSSILRQIEKDTPLLLILEDLEIFTEYSSDEILLLNLLDGAEQLDNIVVLASTNYPEKLKERILNRPSRFDRRYELKFPNEEVREFYFRKKLKPKDLESIDLKKWVDETKGLSVAHLAEVVKSVFALGNTFEETIELLNEMKIKLDSYKFDENKSSSIGFNNRR